MTRLSRTQHGLKFRAAIGSLLGAVLLAACQTLFPTPTLTLTPTLTPTPDATRTEAFAATQEMATKQVTQTARAESLATWTMDIATKNARATDAAQTKAANAERTATQLVTATAVAQATYAVYDEIALHVQAELADVDTNLIYAWPMPPLTDEQIEEARECDVIDLFEKRYDNVPLQFDMAGGYEPANTCDWAVLAAAYAYRADELGLPRQEQSERAYAKVIRENPAFALKNWLYFGYFTRGQLVDPPPMTQSAVETAILQYTFGGIGYSGDTTIVISNANAEPVVSGLIDEDEGLGPKRRVLSGTIDVELVQALGRALTDLVPIDARFYAIACYDYYPDWDVKLVFTDGSLVHIETQGNFLGGGGPWETTIDGQPYIQASGAMPEAVNAIAEAFEVPGGATSAMACFPGGDMLDFAFPER